MLAFRLCKFFTKRQLFESQIMELELVNAYRILKWECEFKGDAFDCRKRSKDFV